MMHLPHNVLKFIVDASQDPGKASGVGAGTGLIFSIVRYWEHFKTETLFSLVDTIVLTLAAGLASSLFIIVKKLLARLFKK